MNLDCIWSELSCCVPCSDGTVRARGPHVRRRGRETGTGFESCPFRSSSCSRICFCVLNFRSRCLRLDSTGAKTPSQITLQVLFASFLAVPSRLCGDHLWAPDDCSLRMAMFRLNSRVTVWKLLLVIRELFRVRMILLIQLNLVCATRSFSGASMRQALHGALSVGQRAEG
jgi:hypothetical protein